jgi:hypothetical protein
MVQLVAKASCDQFLLSGVTRAVLNCAVQMAAHVKLNLGCGSQMLPGYCNVDIFGAPDLRWDLETFPWPWADDAVGEVLLSHVLEHLGQAPQTFIAIMKELYRVCRNGALVTVIVPHPRSDHFIIDPTHVRAITPMMFELFSLRLNQEWQRQGSANTPLALYHGVDFEVVSATSIPEEPYLSLFRAGQITGEQLQELERTQNNVVSQIEMILKVVK